MINENTKVTLTVGQLKRLVLESAGDDSESAKPEFEINEDGELVKYNGTDRDVVVPRGVKKITGIRLDHYTYEGAFERCDMASVKIPNTVEMIGYEAFFACRSLREVTIPDSVEIIGEKAFAQCGNLTYVKIKNPHVSVGKNAFPEKCKVSKPRTNQNTLIQAAARQVTKPTEHSKSGHLSVNSWRNGEGRQWVTVKINGTEHELDFEQAKEFGNKLRDALNAMHAVVLDSEKYVEKSGPWWSSYETTHYDIPTSARVFGKPTHEWDLLCRIVEKYAHVKLDPMKCKFGEASGKRGHLYDPHDWDYIAYDRPEWIRKAIAWIRDKKNTRDTLKVEEFGGSSCENREDSAYYETECYGSKIRSYKFTVVTPNGKVKGEYKLAYGGYWYDS